MQWLMDQYSHVGNIPSQGGTPYGCPLSDARLLQWSVLCCHALTEGFCKWLSRWQSFDGSHSWRLLLQLDAHPESLCKPSRSGHGQSAAKEHQRNVLYKLYSIDRTLGIRVKILTSNSFRLSKSTDGSDAAASIMSILCRPCLRSPEKPHTQVKSQYRDHWNPLSWRR